MPTTSIAGRILLVLSLLVGAPACGAASMPGTASAPVPQTGPSGRTGAALAAAPRRGVVLYGGEVDRADGSITWLFDTWVWDGAWHRATATAPHLYGASMAYDRAHGQLLLLGMTQPLADDDEVADAQRLETWVWTGSAWTRATADAAEPHVTLAHPVVAWDAAGGQLIALERDALAGGATGAMATWRWDGRGWTEIPSATGGAEGPGTPVDHLVSGPDGRLTVPGPAGWSWDGRRWSPATTPLPADAVGSDAPGSGILVLAADPAAPSRPQALLWTAAGAVPEATPPGPAREGAVMATDATRHTTLVVGGPADAPPVLLWDGRRWSTG